MQNQMQMQEYVILWMFEDKQAYQAYPTRVRLELKFFLRN